MDVRTFQHQQELMYTMINQASCEIISLKKNSVEAKNQRDRIESKLDLLLSSNQLSLTAANNSNNSTMIHNTTTTQDQNSIQQNSVTDINTVLSPSSFRKWLDNKAKDSKNKINPIKAFIHHEQFELAQGHKQDVLDDATNGIDKEVRVKNNTAFYKHMCVIKVMNFILGPNVSEFPRGKYDLIPEWQSMITTKLTPALLELRAKYDSEKSKKRTKELLPTTGQLVAWSKKFFQSKIAQLSKHIIIITNQLINIIFVMFF